MKFLRATAIACLALAVAVAFSAGDATAAKKKKLKPLKVSKGTITLTFDRTFVGKLGALTVLPLPIAPATLDANTLTLSVPVTSGTVDKTGKKATLKLSGGLDQRQASTGTRRTVTNLTLKITGKKMTLLGDGGNGSITQLEQVAFLEGTVSQVKKTNKSYSATVSAANLSSLAATDLNSQFANSQPTFAAGELVGTGKGTAKK